MTDVTFQGIVEKIVAQGYGLVRSSQGVVFCPPGTVIPGEKIAFQVKKESKHRLIATQIAILEPSPDRVSPPCKFFEHCGGCNLMHVSYKKQLAIKQDILLESMDRQGIDRSLIPVVQLWKSKEYGYRNRIQLHVQNRSSGFYAQGTNDLVDIDSCTISAKELNQVFQLHLEPGSYQALGPNTEGNIALVRQEKNQPGSRYSHQVPGFSDTLSITFQDLTIESHAGGFFQSNFLGLLELRKRIQSYSKDIAQQYQRPLRAVELYCGQGVLGQALPKEFESILGIDRDNTPHCYAHRGKKLAQPVEEFCKQQKGKIAKPFDLLIADPSRKGLSTTLIPWIREQKIPYLVFVFCDPVSAARDLGIFLSLG